MSEIEFNDSYLTIYSPTVMINQNYVIATDINQTMILAKKDNTSDSQKWTLEKTGSNISY